MKFQRGLPDTIKVSASVYQSKIVWRTLARSYLVNNNGIVYKEVEGATDLPIIQDRSDLSVQLGSQVVSTNFIDFIIATNSRFAEKTGFKIANFEVNETIFQVDAFTDQGWKIKFDTTRSVDDQLDALNKLIGEPNVEIHEYADVRVEGRVYYK